METDRPPENPRPARMRSFVIRGGRMSEARKKALAELPPGGPFLKPEDWADWYRPFERRLLEIGFGMGHATVEIAVTIRTGVWWGWKCTRPEWRGSSSRSTSGA